MGTRNNIFQIFHSQFNAKETYEEILKRLIDDVEPAVSYYRKTGKGNWATIRMIAPIIETLGCQNQKYRNVILQELGIDYPIIFWVMYRNGLLHNDSWPQSIQLGTKSVGWGFNWNQSVAATMVKSNLYSINPALLFDNLKRWLELKINNTKGTNKINIPCLVEIDEKVNSPLKEEFLKMITEND